MQMCGMVMKRDVTKPPFHPVQGGYKLGLKGVNFVLSSQLRISGLLEPPITSGDRYRDNLCF